MHTCTPNQCPYLESTFYTLQNPRNRQHNILKLMVTTTRSKKKSRSLHEVSHLHPLTNDRTTYQLSTPYTFRDIAQTRFYRSRSLWQGQRSNQGHTMTMHTYYPQPMCHPSINFLHLTVSEIARTRFYWSRSLRQGQRSTQGHTITLHTDIPYQCH